VDGGVPQPLPRKPAIGSTALHPSVKALHHSPQTLIHSPHPLRALHVDAILHGEHVRRVHPALQPPPGYDVAYLQGVEEVEHSLGLELAVGGEQLHLHAFTEHPGQQRLYELLLVDVQRGLDVAQGKALYVDEEEALVSEEEAFLASAEAGVGVSEAPSGIVGVPAAPRGEVCAVYAGGLDEAGGG